MSVGTLEGLSLLAPYIEKAWVIKPKDPLLWVEQRLPERHLWSKQQDVARSVVEHKRTAVKACHGVGKSYISGTLAAWMVDAYPVGDVLVVSTAPSAAQVGAILWHEIGRAHKEGGLAGKIGLDNKWMIDREMVGIGRKPADHDEHGFQGLHRPIVFVIADEACGIPTQLWTAFEAVTTNDDCRILAIGNPDDPSSEFAKVCSPGSGWNVITISAFDSPNLTGEEVPENLSKMLVSEDWVEDKRKRWGEASPRYQSKILGEFPELGDNTLIAPRWILDAQERELEPEGKTRVSVDVARFGSDHSIIALARGPVFRVEVTMPTSATTEVAGATTRVLRENGNCDVIIDGAGVGGGVVDSMRENVREGVFGVGRRPTVREFLAGGKPKDEKEFADARSEAWWRLREMFREGEIDIDPADDELASQLGSIQYGFDSKGRIKVESKDDMAKRKLPSPDRGDAAMQAYALTGQDAPRVTASGMGRRVDTRGRARR